MLQACRSCLFHLLPVHPSFSLVLSLHGACVQDIYCLHIHVLEVVCLIHVAVETVKLLFSHCLIYGRPFSPKANIFPRNTNTRVKGRFNYSASCCVCVFVGSPSVRHVLDR